MQEYEYEYAQFIYYTPGRLDKQSQLWPVRAGRSIAKPSYEVGPKRIECHSLHFVYEGKVRIEWAGKWAELHKGDLFCLFPGRTYHYRQLPSEAPLRMNWLALDGARVGSLLELAGVTPDRPFRKKAVTSSVKASAERVIDALSAAERRKPAAALALQGIVCELFAGLILDAAPIDAKEHVGWIRECLDFIELHATEGISVQQVASFAGVHRSYFSDVFAEQVGMPPMKYIQKIRMEKAISLLTETDATITEVALSLGYPNLYTFTRAFKVYYKVPPLSVRSTRSAPSVQG
ncbi:AraC family transcriptional regulator [Cohnella sp. F6_2S_P_1]|uniref:AraC family transcriptional regulator n=2 Tax=Cohnella hashimotonis TaxID=2826895 RepID=A0ABT6TEA5_9BACL|nr:AraC family transcriptional regulator [Cohnella hashimotonis]MDI4644665.1 AraC family transcriptional regulator [Cohnella hashimotonis]